MRSLPRTRGEPAAGGSDSGNGPAGAEPGERTQEAVEIPAVALPLLQQILDAIADGHSVAVVDDDAELSTEQAAELLGVSGRFLAGLLERGAIPLHQVGDQRLVRIQDLMDYRRRDEAERLKALEELAVQAQELNMGY